MYVYVVITEEDGFHKDAPNEEYVTAVDASLDKKVALKVRNKYRKKSRVHKAYVKRLRLS